MAAPYAFWIYGTNTNHQTFHRQTSLTPTVSSGTAGATLPDASLANGWITVPAWGASPELIRESEDYQTAGNGQFNGPMEGRWQLTILTDDFDFPDDWENYVELLQAINKRYIYVAAKTYADGVSINYGNTAIAIASAHKVEHDYPNGKKRLTLTFKYRYPHNELAPIS